MTGHVHALVGLDRLGLDDAARNDFLHSKAERVFKLEGKVHT